MRSYPIPKIKLPHWVGPDDDGSADCPDCQEDESGKCSQHGDCWPSPMDDIERAAAEDL